MVPSPAPFVILTGDRGIGKSTVCAALRDLLAARGLRCGGFITHRERGPSGATLGLRLEDAATGELFPLASTGADLGGPRVGPFSMHQPALSRGIASIRRAIAGRHDLVFLDEIGPLELEQGDGFAAAIPLAVRHPWIAVILVARTALAETVLRRLGRREARLQTVTAENRDALPAELADEILGRLRPPAQRSPAAPPRPSPSGPDLA